MNPRTDSRSGRPGAPPSRVALLLIIFLMAFISAAGLLPADCQDDCCHQVSQDDLCVAFCCGGLAVTVQAAYRLPELSGSGRFTSPALVLLPGGILEPPFRPPTTA